VLRRVATNQSGTARVAAILRIQQFGELATPVLAACVEDPDTDVKLESMWGIRQLRLEPSLCIPALTNQLHHADTTVRRVAIETIASFGWEARPVLQSLLDALKDSDSAVRAEATSALKQIAPEVLTNGIGR
jgi:HEAT repeat protein